MKFLKYIAGIIVILAIIPLALPSQMQVERSIQINNTTENNVFSYVVNLQTWPEWSPWLEEDPQGISEFTGVPGVVGSYQEWTGPKMGAGKQTLTLVREPDYMETQLEFFDPASSPATGYMKIEPFEGGVTLIWGMKGALAYPIERVIGLFIPGMIQEKFDLGLKNIKTNLENTAQTDIVEPIAPEE